VKRATQYADAFDWLDPLVTLAGDPFYVVWDEKKQVD